MPWRRLVINPAGFVCPACHCKKMVGNVLESSLSEIWNNEGMQMYRRKISNHDYSDLCNPGCINNTISQDLRGLQ
jgi:MoaA/NifB/PqqE/SkfB family radical SAM enzyme